MKEAEFSFPAPAPVPHGKEAILHKRRDILRAGVGILSGAAIAGMLAACGAGGSESGRNPLVPKTTPTPKDTSGRNPLVPDKTPTPKPPQNRNPLVPEGTHVAVTPDNRPAYLKDLVPKEELEQVYHTRIADINVSPTDYIHLSLRRGALLQPPYKDLPGTRDSLTIGLVNGPVLDPKYLTTEQKSSFPDLPDVLSNISSTLIQERLAEIQKDRTQKLIDYNQSVTDLNTRLQNKTIPQDYYDISKQLLDYNNRLYLTARPTNEDLLESTLGVYTYVDILGGAGGRKKYIFLPVRDFADITLKSDHGPATYTFARSKNRFPNPSESYPDQNSFTIDPNQKVYPIVGGNTPGSTVRHEEGHAAGYGHPDTDYRTINNLNNASNKFHTTGDDSDYYLVWETYPYQYTVTRDPHPQAIPLTADYYKKQQAA